MNANALQIYVWVCKRCSSTITEVKGRVLIYLRFIPYSWTAECNYSFENIQFYLYFTSNFITFIFFIKSFFISLSETYYKSLTIC